MRLSLPDAILNSEGLILRTFLTFSLTKLLNLTGGNSIDQPHAKHNLLEDLTLVIR